MEFEVASLTNKLNAILAELQSKAPCPIVAESDISPHTSSFRHQPSALRHHTSLPCPGDSFFIDLFEVSRMISAPFL